MRLRGICSSHAARTLSDKLCRHIGLDKPGGDRVHSYAAGRKLARYRLGQADHARLRGSVVGLPGIAHQALTELMLMTQPPRWRIKVLVSARVVLNVPFEIDIEHAVEGIVTHTHEQAVARDAGVVDERPNGAKVVENHFHARIDGSGVCHVALICARAVAPTISQAPHVSRAASTLPA